MLRLHVHHRTTYSYSRARRVRAAPARAAAARRPRPADRGACAADRARARDHVGARRLRQFAGARRFHGAAPTGSRSSATSRSNASSRFPSSVSTSRGSCRGPCTMRSRSKPVIDAYRRLSFPDDAGELAEMARRELPRRAERCRRDAARSVQPRARAITYRRRAEKRRADAARRRCAAASGSCRDMATLHDGRGAGARHREPVRERIRARRGLAGGPCVDARVDGVLSAGARLARLRPDDRQSRSGCSTWRPASASTRAA